MNILEQVAVKLKNDMEIAFKDNSVSTLFLEIGKSTDGKVIGRQFPQTDYIELEKAHSLELYSLANENLVFDNIEIYKSSKLTDCISTFAFEAHAYLLSKKALNVFKQFNLGKYRIYPATVFHKGEPYEYGVLHFTNDLHSNLDFNKSSFYISDAMMLYKFDIDINSSQMYDDLRAKISNGEIEETDEYDYIQLKYGVFKEKFSPPDIFSIYCSSIGDYISVKLGQAIIDNELTGFSLERVYNL